jgi:pimeloyl-ACP methyl ester carboxylesterase
MMPLSADNAHLGWSVSSLPVFGGVAIRYGHNQNNEQKQITLFSHGIGGDADQALYYIMDDVFCTDWVATFDYADAPAHIGKQNIHTGFAQQGEIDCFKAALKATIALEPEGIHLYGVSNGASVIINALDQLLFEGADLTLIKSIVLESPYADVNDCMQAFAKQLVVVPTFLVRFLAKRWFKQLSFSKNKPIDAVSTLHALNVPVLFIALDNDKIVPYASTHKLYETLKRVSFAKTELISVEFSLADINPVHHANLMNPTTIAAVHAFYAQHTPHTSANKADNEGLLKHIKRLIA